MNASGVTPRYPADLEDAPLWIRDDAAWFAAHPDRTHRARAVFPGEPKRGTHVVLRQLAPGIRLWRAFTPGPDLPVSSEELNRRDIFGWATFDLLNQALAQGRTIVPPADIGARIMTMLRGGSA